MNDEKEVIKSRLSRLLPVLVFLLAAALRFPGLSERAPFLGEQGRDLIVAGDILHIHKLTLLGPATSLSANIHFGPFYHYFNAFWLAVFNDDPLGPAIGFAVLNFAACFGLYRLGRLWIGKSGALAAAALFAVSPLMVRFSQAMFNSYFVVSLTVFSLLGLAVFRQKGKIIYLGPAGVFAGLAVQANFLAFTLLPAALAWLWLNLKGKRSRLAAAAVYLLSFGLACTPYLVFELRHDFFNLRGLVSWLTAGNIGGGQAAGSGTMNALYSAFYYSVGLENRFLTVILILWLAAVVFWRIKKRPRLPLGWLLPGLVLFLGLEIYLGTWAPHYLGILYPVVFLLIGFASFPPCPPNNKKRFSVGTMVVLALLAVNLTRAATDAKRPNPSEVKMSVVKESAKIIASDAAGRFNVVNLLEGDTRGYAYRYLLRLAGRQPLGVEAYPESETLYVVSPTRQDDILAYPVWEIYSFLPAGISETWSLDHGIVIYRLTKK